MVHRPCKSDISYSVHSTFVWQINLCISTLRTSAICANVFKSGSAWLLHHFDTVAGSLCNVFANYLLIIPLSANMVLTRFKSAILKLFVVFAAKLLLLTGNKDYIHIKLPKKVLFSQIQGIWLYTSLYTDNKVKLSVYKRMGIVSTASHSILSFDSVHLFLVSSIILSSKPHICLHEIMLTLLTPVVFRSFFWILTDILLLSSNNI